MGQELCHACPPRWHVFFVVFVAVTVTMLSSDNDTDDGSPPREPTLTYPCTDACACCILPTLTGRAVVVQYAGVPMQTRACAVTETHRSRSLALIA